MRAFYNEIDRYCCDWLSNLMDAGLITPGRIDDRSITDLSPDDVRGYERVHFFAGIAGWDLALNLAGWDDGFVWTGSCPCQPFSAAGKGKAADDERHLWPSWFSLIRECRPATIYGEQVEAAIGWGWLDAVFSDLEAQDYACGAAVLPACSVGAPHSRQRLYFVGRCCRPDADCCDKHRRNSTLQMGRQSCSRIIETVSFGGRDQWSAESKPPTLANGISSRMEQCRAAGNAIVPQVAAEFIKACIGGTIC